MQHLLLLLDNISIALPCDLKRFFEFFKLPCVNDLKIKIKLFSLIFWRVSSKNTSRVISSDFKHVVELIDFMIIFLDI